MKIFKKKSNKSDEFGCEFGSVCGLKSCRREIKSTTSGRLWVENMLTCGITQKQLDMFKSIADDIDRRNKTK